MTGLLHASHSRAVRWTVVAYALCLSGATFNHLHDLYVGGWLPYVGAPPGVNAYWTGLTFLDPLAVALLVVRPRSGLILTLDIMMCDVAVNFWMAHGAGSGALLAHAEPKRFQSMPWKDRHRFPSYRPVFFSFSLGSGSSSTHLSFV